MDLSGPPAAALHESESFAKLTNLRLCERRVQCVFNVGEMRISAFNFQCRKLLQFVDERCKLADGNPLTICSRFDLEVNLRPDSQLGSSLRKRLCHIQPVQHLAIKIGRAHV